MCSICCICRIQRRVTLNHDDELIHGINATTRIPALQNIEQALIGWRTAVHASLVLLNFAYEIRQSLLRRFGILTFFTLLIQAERNKNTDYDKGRLDQDLR